MTPFGSRILRKTAWLWTLCGLAALPAHALAATDTCGYPDNSNLPRSGVVFNESTVLRAFVPATAATIIAGQTITISAFYSDEHALTLGVRRAIVNGVPTDFAITQSSSSPTCFPFPQVGATDQSGNDTAAGGGRPLWPALFITDLTLNGLSSRIGDWQQGGTGIPPSRVCGVWKSAVKTVSGSTITVTPDVDPPKNNWNLGGGDPVPAGLSNEGYGAEVSWDVTQVFQAGHRYRLQFMVHDGDQNKTGGDVGEGCTTVTVVERPRVHVEPAESHICVGTTVQLCAVVDNPGLPPDRFQWSNGATSQCITVPAPPAGTSVVYTVTMTDAVGQQASASGTVFGHTCSVNLAKAAFPPDICAGTPGQVFYGYAVHNASDFFSASGTLVDDSGTPGNPADDFTAPWGPLAPGQTVTFGRPATLNITAPLTNTATATGTSGNAPVSATARATVRPHLCSILLAKRPDVCEVQEGVPTPVLYRYRVLNSGDFFAAQGTLVDDNGTPGNPGDDVTVCNWGPIAPGDGADCTHTFTLTGSRTNIATASGTSGNATVTAQATATVSGFNCVCNLSYPDNSNLPRSGVVFNESGVLRASSPGNGSCATTGSTIKLWYNDEHALTLGVHRVIVKNAFGTTTTDYAVTPTPTSGPTCVPFPQVGATDASGDQSGNDIAAGGGRPLWPALFITDLTVNGASSRAGDWQQGGTGVPPSRVCGTWKGAVRTVDNTSNPPKVTVTPDADPAKNDWNLGGGDPAPAGLANEGYGAECSWDLSLLGLQAGHTYRLQFMVHDGDQNKSGGDVGQSCAIAHVPQTGPCVPTTATAAATTARNTEGQGAATTDLSQSAAPSPVVEALPTEFALLQNFPNPFRESTVIRYALPEASTVSLKVFNIFGQEVATLASGTMSPGYHSMEWKARDHSDRPVPAGMYFYRMDATGLKTGTFHQLRKMVLIK